jgi:cytoskeletal protein CcmA (bactofilin family)
MFWMQWLLTASAVEVRRGDTVTVPESEVVEGDLYVVARAIRIDGIVTGDVVLVGRTVRLDGRVEGDALIAGWDVLVSGGVADDLRAAAATLQLFSDSRIGGYFIAAGWTIETQPGSAVATGAALIARRALLEGDIGGDLLATAATLRLDGPVAGGVEARVGRGGLLLPSWWEERLPPGLTLGPRAEVDGVLAYQATQPARIEPGARITGAVEGSLTQADSMAPVWAAVRRFVGLLMVGAIAVWIAPRFLDRAADRVTHRLLPSLGVGAAALLGWVVALGVVALVVATLAWLFGWAGLDWLSALVVAAGGVTGLGSAVALLLAVHWLAQTTVAVAIGERVFQNRFAALALGLLLVAILSAIPILDAVAGIFIMLLGLGGMVLAALRRPREPVAA